MTAQHYAHHLIAAASTPAPGPFSGIGDPFQGGNLLLVGVGVASLALAGITFFWKGDGMLTPRDGFASKKDLKRAAMTGKALRRKAPILSPGAYGDFTKRQTRKIHPARVGGLLGTTVVGSRGQDVYAAYEHSTQIVAPPRIGKTALLASRIIDAPGPVIATSMRADLVELSATLRGGLGRVFCFNPDGMGGLANTVYWSPIAGCEDPRMAIERAGYMLSGASGAEGVTNRSFWEGSAFEVLRSYLHAAALGGKDMRDLWRWAQGGSAEEAAQILSYDERAADGWSSSLSQTLKMGGKDGTTKDSILRTLSLALGFMADPMMAKICCPPEGRHFDVDAFMTSKSDTLYLLGSDRPHSSVAPVFVALLGEMYERGRLIASRNRGGRLDPVVSFHLDEACNISPVPLERWVTTSGGAGMHVTYVIQDVHQLIDRYGQAAAKTIQTGATVKVVLGGVDDIDYLRGLSLMCGTKWIDDPSTTVNASGGVSTHRKKAKVPTLTEKEINLIPDFQALILGGNRKATIVQFTPVWKRKDAKRAAKDLKNGGFTVADVVEQGPDWTSEQRRDAA